MCRFLLCAGVALTVVTGGIAAAHPADVTDEGHPVLAAIDRAWQNGEITEAEALLYRCYLVKAPQKLPARFHVSDAPLRCGTAILMEVYARAAELPAVMREEIESYRIQQPLRTVIETEHFCIHTNQPPGDAYADSVAAACERSWRVLHEDLNWDVPPPDGSYGCFDKIDCWIEDLGETLLGYAEPLELVPGDPPYDFTGTFHIDDTIGNWCTLKATVTHEYFHVVEFGYFGYSNATWYMENCAMLAEEWVYDECNDYMGYLNCFFNRPYKPISTLDGCFEYGAVVWPMYQSEHFTPDDPALLVEAIWDRFQWNGNVFTAHDEALAPYGYTMATAYLEFIRWCFYTRERDDDQHFAEAGEWPVVLWADQTFDTYPTGDQGPTTTMRPWPYGTSMMKFRPEDGNPSDRLEVQFNGPNCTLGVQFITKKLDTLYCDEYSMTLDPNGNGTISIPGFASGVEFVFMMTSMSRYCSGAQDYIFSADNASAVSDDASAGSGPLALLCSSNPNRGSTRLTYALSTGREIDLRILSSDGRCVRTLLCGWQAAGPNEVIWNGCDETGRPVGRGLYWVRLQAGDQVASRRLVRLW